MLHSIYWITFSQFSFGAISEQFQSDYRAVLEQFRGSFWTDLVQFF